MTFKKFTLISKSAEMDQTLTQFLLTLTRLNPDLLDFDVELLKEKKAKATPAEGDEVPASPTLRGGPKVFYAAINLPVNPLKCKEAIEENLKAIGEGKMLGKVYLEVANATLENRKITKPDVMKALKIPAASTAERLLGDLTRMNLAKSLPIDFNLGA